MAFKSKLFSRFLGRFIEILGGKHPQSLQAITIWPKDRSLQLVNRSNEKIGTVGQFQPSMRQTQDPRIQSLRQVVSHGVESMIVHYTMKTRRTEVSPHLRENNFNHQNWPMRFGTGPILFMPPGFSTVIANRLDLDSCQQKIYERFECAGIEIACLDVMPIQVIASPRHNRRRTTMTTTNDAVSNGAVVYSRSAADRRGESKWFKNGRLVTGQAVRYLAQLVR